MGAEEVYAALVSDWDSETRSVLPFEQFFYFEEIDSTNDALLNSPLDSQLSLLAVAEFQSRGRGRRGDQWVAPHGKNLLFSIRVPLRFEPMYWARIPQYVAWKMASVIRTALDSNLSIQVKWPNDLYLQGQKLGGILVETSPAQRDCPAAAVIGLGLNVNVSTETFPPELRPIATSLYDHLGCESSRWYLLSEFIAEFFRGFPDEVQDFDGCLQWIRTHDFLLGKDFVIRDQSVSQEECAVQGVGVGDHGELLVRNQEGGIEKIISADRIVF